MPRVDQVIPFCRDTALSESCTKPQSIESMVMAHSQVDKRLYSQKVDHSNVPHPEHSSSKENEENGVIQLCFNATNCCLVTYV